MQTLTQITFLYPYAFLLLLLYFICQKYCKTQLPTIYFSNLRMLQTATSKNKSLTKILKYLILFFIVLSLSSPVIKNELVLNNSQGYEISLILDASGSMHEDDRFNITKKIVSEFIKKRKTDRLALSVFADFAYIAVPLTYDKQSLLAVIKHIKIGVAGTRDTSLYEALYLNTDLFKDSSSKNKIAILLTDGLNTIDSIPLKVAISKTKKYGIKVYTIGVGQKNTYNKKVLENISAQTGGKFFETSNPKELEYIYEQINKLEKSKIKTTKYTHKEYLYQYPLSVALLLLSLLFILNKDIKKRSSIYLMISFIFISISIYRPTIDGEIVNTSQKNLKVMVAFDISKSMMATDIYPTRLEFAQNKFYHLLKSFKNEKIGILGFSNQSYIISPITNDYKILKFLVQRLSLDTINKKGSNIFEAIKSTNKLLESKEKKALIIFTDGTEQKEFKKEIEYANQNKISLFIYNIGTQKGGVLYDKRIILKDKDGNIVITKLNKNIESLATQTDGSYLKYSLKSDVTKEFVIKIQNEFNSKKTSNNQIKNDKELFFIPLILAFIFFLLTTVKFKNPKEIE